MYIKSKIINEMMLESKVAKYVMADLSADTIYVISHNTILEANTIMFFIIEAFACLSTEAYFNVFAAFSCLNVGIILQSNK